jgi:hypothetical protein
VVTTAPGGKGHWKFGELAGELRWASQCVVRDLGKLTVEAQGRGLNVEDELWHFQKLSITGTNCTHRMWPEGRANLFETLCVGLRLH